MACSERNAQDTYVSLTPSSIYLPSRVHSSEVMRSKKKGGGKLETIRIVAGFVKGVCVNAVIDQYGI